MKKTLVFGALFFAHSVVFSQTDVHGSVKFKSVKAKAVSSQEKAGVVAACGNDTVRYAGNKAYYLQAGFNDPTTGGWSVNKQTAATNIVTTAYKVPAGGSVTVTGAEILGLMMLTSYGAITTPTVSTHKVYLYTVDATNKPLLKIDSANVVFTEVFDSRRANWINGPHTLTSDFAIGVKGGATSAATHFLYVAYNQMHVASDVVNPYGEHLSFKYQAAAGGFVDMASNFGSAIYDFEFSINPIVTYNYSVDFTPSVTVTCPSSPVTLTNASVGSEIFKSHSFSLGAFAARYNVNEGAGAMDLPRDSIFQWYTGINTQVLQNAFSSTSFTNQALPGTYNDTLYVVALTHDYNYCFQKQIISYTVNPIVTPTFSISSAICEGSTAPTLATTSTNSITGTWAPATISNTTSGSYVFTPTAGACATPTTASVTVTPNVTTTFAVINPFCSGTAAPTLNTTSTNSITGTWVPSTVSNTASGSYLFTPTAGVCATTYSASVTVTPNVTTTFATIAPFCIGTTAPLLNTTSTNSIAGTWSPSTISNTTSGTYLFTPTAGVCATTYSASVTVNALTNPTFSIASTICTGTTAPLLNTTSTNSITGAWSPSVVSNTTSGSYVFTPDAGQCAATLSQSVTVTTVMTTPTFATVPAFCSGTTAPVLATTSTNSIAGTWSPLTVDNLNSATYTFTPLAGSCASSTTADVTVTPNVTTTFASIAPFCSGSTAPALNATSTNSITGTWVPSVVSNTTSGSYLFTPTAGVCATTYSASVTVTPNVTPTFVTIAPFCTGTTAPSLNTTSTNSITGTWSPATISNTASGIYVFTPTAGVCATIYSASVTVTPNVTPTFATIAPFCSGTIAPSLNTTSTNSITGTWSPATISNTTSGNYLFTPTAGVCATTYSASVTVTPNVTPTFATIAPFCAGTTAPLLSTTSTNAITGTWNPAIIDNTTAGTTLFAFTPTAGECASIVSISVTVLDCAGINENAGSTFSVYPNPANDKIVLTFLNENNGTIYFYAADGKLVEQRDCQNSLIESFNVNSLTSGVYFFKIGNVTEKVIIN